eukprot:3369479-Prorocentrum_lima.AAC.1
MSLARADLPATVVLVKPDGNIHIEWQGNTLIRHCSHVCRASIYWTYVAADVLTSHIDDALTP